MTLWSTNVEALEALSQPDSIALHFVRNEVYGPDALAPRTGSRRNRKTTSLGLGKVWRVDESSDAAKSDPMSSTLSSSASSEVTLSGEDTDVTNCDGASTIVESVDEVEREIHSRDDLFAEESVMTPVPMANAPSAAQSEAARFAAASMSSSDTSLPPTSSTTVPSVTTLEPVPSIAPIKLQLDGPIRLGPKPRPPFGTGVGPMASSKHVSRPARRSPLAQVAASAPEEPRPSPLGINAELGDDPAKSATEGAEGAEGVFRAPSPVPSNEDDDQQFPGEEDKGMIIHLRGEVTITKAAGLPSFNYKYLNRNVRHSALLSYRFVLENLFD